MPCPICHKPDWCSVSANDALVNCMRVSDGAIKLSRNGGHLHLLRDSHTPQRTRSIIHSYRPRRKDLPDLAKYCRELATKREGLIESLSRRLGLPRWTLDRLHVGWSERRQAYTFPMRDGTGRIIGIHLRGKNGRKCSITGSRIGLFIPERLDKPNRLFICEGPTDCAALLSLGFTTIGRPSCTGGTRLIIKWIQKHQPSQVIVVADSDTPGRRGAKSLASVLCLHVSSTRIIKPPRDIKDIRDWLHAGASKNEIKVVVDSAPVFQLRMKGKP